MKGHVEHPTNGLFEKSEIRWFTVDDLKREKHIFRDYFRNIIDIVIYNHPKTLSKLKRAHSGNRTIRTSRVKFSTSDLMKCERIRKHKNNRKTHKRDKRGFKSKRDRLDCNY